MQISHQKLNTFRKFASPPKNQATTDATSTAPTDTFAFSGAQAKDGPRLSTLQAVGLGVGLTVAVGGAFIAGSQFGQPEEVTFESQVQDAERGFKRDWEDFKVDLKRAGEDMETGWRRGWEDAQQPVSREKQQQREYEDAKRELKREVEDFKKDAGREWKDFWRELTN